MPTPVSKREGIEAVTARLCHMKFEAQCRHLLDVMRRDPDALLVEGESHRSGSIRVSPSEIGQGTHHARH